MTNVEKLLHEMYLGHKIIETVAAYCTEVKLSMNDADVRGMIEASLTRLVRTLPSEARIAELQGVAGDVKS